MALSQNTFNHLKAALSSASSADEVRDLLVLIQASAGTPVTPGTVTANKAVVVGANKEIDTLAIADGGLKLGSGAGTAVNATAAEINAAADVSARLVALTDADTPILVANSGKPHLIPDVTADRTFTLPTPASGLEYVFYPKLNAADGHDWIFNTGSDTNFFVGGVTFLDTDAGAGSDELVVTVPDGNSNSKFQINLPAPGTVLRFICDGTLWLVAGVVCSTTAPTYADQ